MFTGIGIENFKAFGKMQSIHLKPITLIYGPNSSGKSSLMQSLLLFKQTLEESGDGKIVLLPKGNLVDLGGYQEFINGHDTKKDFNLSLSFKYSWAMMQWYDDIWERGKWADLSLEYSFSQDKTGEILLKSIKTRDSLHPDPIMEWKNVWMIPYLKRAVLKKKVEFESDDNAPEEIDRWLYDLKRSVLVMDYMNLAHCLIKNYWDGYAGALNMHLRVKVKGYSDPTNGHYKQTVTEMTKLRKHLEEEYKKLEAEDNKLNVHDAGLKDEELQEKKDKFIVSQAGFRQLERILRLSRIMHRSLMHASYEDFLKIRNFPGSNRLISVANCFPSDKEVDLSGKEEWLFQNIPEFAALGKTTTDTTEIYDAFNRVSILLTEASSYFKEYLRRIVYIGPLREYPERVYSYSGNIPSNVGKSGKYTPDILMKRPDLVTKINEWFDRLDIGYELRVDVLKRNLFSLSLVDENTGFDVSPKDVGFGIGQLLPILVQGVLSENKILLIEQPEIHVHPRLQAELGSFFAKMAGRTATEPYFAFNPNEEEYGNQFIIETHSEHLILRLLRLIRETTNGELKEGERPLRPEDVAVIYAKPTENGTELMELRISEDGDFIDKWPDGFFTEREKELF
jgi:predicted ATPase